ncbi:ent-kaurene synthase 1, chloroplastic isoform X1 [Lactuca sativa]|uniref:ent-kaurene synthase 1, chloroplastic isoform X1 n=1 Tax=Lactuca sativa TaxID=4236 RepID=UPI000CC24472|nr:ent-kaurene synthase 1, chloroplastic isoform X1 [Lactuca sativa]
MNIAQITSSAMLVPSSHIPHRSWVVNCCMVQYNPSGLRTVDYSIVGLIISGFTFCGSSFPRLNSGFLFAASSQAGQVNPTVMTLDVTKERIRKLFNNVEVSVSSYDTAWVAMVPSPNSPKSPCFPDCLNWLLDNQLDDGSWGLLPHQSPLIKDTLSSTLACVLALKRWNVGKDQINKGLHYIESNFASVTDKNQASPFGFDIIFPGMLEYAKDLDIKLPLNQTHLSVMLHERELELRRCHSNGREAYLAYISEGLGNLNDWNMVMKYQMKNGSLFNSPSATASVLIHHQNAGCLHYLTSLLDKFGNAVPTVYPIDLYVRLSMVDTLERLGIKRHFMVEIQNVLDETYRCWVQGDVQIFMDVVTCALAFRVLRSNGYEVSSDPLAKITKEGDYMNSPEKPFKDVYTSLEVYKASQIIYQEELAFREQNLTSYLPSSNKLSNYILKEVDDALKFPFNGSLERMSTRRNIEHYNLNHTRILKTTYSSSNISNKDYLKLAVQDFNECQSIYCEELKDLERWVVENRLDKLKFARQKTAYCYFSAASFLSSPDLSDARISWAKSSILTTVIDDFFDVGGSMDELVNFVHIIEKWNVNVENDCCSEEVGVLFLALKDAVCWIGDKAFKIQERNITSHVIEIWLDLVKSMLREAIWAKDGSIPTINEYMENGYVSFALGPIVLPTLYFLGVKLSEEVVQSSEYHKLYEVMSTQGRLMNDIHSFKREKKAGKLNAVALYMSDGKSGSVEEEVVEEMKILTKSQRKEMMKLVLETKGSVVPRVCKDVFWNMCNVLNLFYATDDGFTGNAILDVVKEIIYEPVSHELI